MYRCPVVQNTFSISPNNPNFVHPYDIPSKKPNTQTSILDSNEIQTLIAAFSIGILLIYFIAVVFLIAIPTNDAMHAALFPFTPSPINDNLFQADYKLRSLLQANSSSGKGLLEINPDVIALHGIQRWSGSSTFDPNDAKYIQGLIILGAPGGILALSSIVFAAFFIILRYSCGMCGSRQRSLKGYKKWEHYATRVFMIIFAFTVGVLCVIGVSGNSNAQSSFTSFTYGVNSSSISIESNLLYVQQLLLNFNPNTTATKPVASINQLQQTASHFQNNTNNSLGLVSGLNLSRTVVMGFGYVIIMIIMIVGLMGAFTKNGTLALVTAIGTCIGMGFIWLSYGIHFPLNVMVADICILINDTESGTDDLSVMDYFLHCFGNDTTNDTIYGADVIAINNIVTYLTQARNDSQTRLNMIANSTTNASSGFTAEEQNLAEILNYTSTIKNLLSCPYVSATFDESTIKAALCYSMVEALYKLWASQLAIGFLLGLATANAILGIKRFEGWGKGNKKVAIALTGCAALTFCLGNE